MKKALSLAMAGVMAASTCIVASAEDNNAELTSMLSMVKERITVSDELSEFDYGAGKQGPVTVYDFNWTTPRGAEQYKSVSVTAYGSVITGYYTYGSESSWRDTAALAKLSSDRLYSKAVAAIKKLNPTIASSIKVDKSSINMNVRSSDATFRINRVKNGIPVKGDSGRITLNKDTGELISFNISWHPKASFKSKKGVLSEDKAWEKYGELISLVPRYEIDYDWEKDEYTSRLVYRQSDYGEINAFTGEKSNFETDGYYGDVADETCEAAADASVENPATGGFTPQELAEITKELPYGNEQAVTELIKSNKYLTFDDGMVLNWDDVYKEKRGGKEQYIYSASFSTRTTEDYFGDIEVPVTEELAAELAAGGTAEAAAESYAETPAVFPADCYITVDAETGEILSYAYYTSADTTADSYDMAKADKLAREVMKSLAPSHVKDYTDYSSEENTWNYTVIVDGKKSRITEYGGSWHTFNRVVNDITVSGNDVSIAFDGNMRLTNFNLNYNDVEFADPKGMLTADEALAKFREKNDLELFYKARTGKTKTATVLVYGADTNVYCDAFTGEQIYNWDYSNGNDLSGIKDSSVLAKAKVLDDNGIYIANGKFTEDTAVTQADFVNLVTLICEDGSYPKGDTVLPSGKKFECSNITLTRADAMVLFTILKCSNSVADIKGIFKNPFKDVKDDDSYLGYYAIAYALGAAGGETLNGDSDYTYGEVINLVYDSMT